MRKHYVPKFYRNFLMLVAMVCATVSLRAQTDISIGTGTVGNGNTEYPTPLQDWYEGSRMQYLFLASELQAAGMSIGNISAIKWNVVRLGTSTNTNFEIQNYTISIGGSTVSSLGSTTWEPVSQTVYGPTNYLPVMGVNTFNFATPFFWNGTDNIVIEVCNGQDGNDQETWYTGNSEVPWTTGLSFNGSHSYRADNLGNLCGTTTTTNTGTQTTRPNITFVWSAASACTGTPDAGTATSDVAFVCPGGGYNLLLTGSTSASGLIYQWQSSPDGVTWTNIPGANSLTYSGTQTETNYYRAIVTCTNGGGVDASDPVQITTPSAISGTFTINSALPTGGTNFASFNDAYDYIKCGITGPVVFNVAGGSGPYNEQLIMQAVPGASATNTITFNGNGATITYSSGATDQRAVIKLDGADHVTFDNLVITATGTYGFGVHIIGDADSNTVSNSVVNIDEASTSTNYAGLVISASHTSATGTGAGGQCDGNLFLNNTVNGGYYSITVVGGSADVIQNNSVVGNTIRNFYWYGIYLSYTNNTLAEKNDIARPTRTVMGTSMYGIYMTGAATNALVTKNRIHQPYHGDPTTTDNFYGVYTTGVDATAGNENEISNNLIYDVVSNGAAYGFYNSSSNYVNYYHNTVSFDDAASNVTEETRGFYQITAANNLNYYNNIVTIRRGGTGTQHGFYLSTSTTTFTSNNNNILVNPGTDHYFGRFGTTDYATIGDWQTGTSQDAASTILDPIYLNTAGEVYMPTNAALDNLGTPVGVTTDIDDAARSVTTPDIGAYEFSVGPCVVPPEAGTAESNVTGSICPNTPVTLNLTGYSIGIGLTIQWESATSLAGPWTPISGVLTTPTFDIAPTETLFYRAAVTCSGNTDYSDEVEIIVNPLFPAGTYTINSGLPTGGTNFASFNDAYDAMRCGIAGPIIFNVVGGSGPYNEQLVMDEIQGTSSTNTITFNGNGETITFLSTSSAERATIKLQGVDYVTFDNLVVVAEGSASGDYGFGFHLINNSDFNTINNCTINITQASTSTNFGGIIVSNSHTSATTTGETQCDNNTFSNNTITGGYYGMTLVGSTTVANGNNQIVNNTIQEYYFYGLYMNGSFNTLVENNLFTRPTRTNVSTHQGIYVTSLNSRANITRNRITNPFGGEPTATSLFYGIYFTGVNTIATLENVVSNNLIYNITGDGDVYGFYNTNSDNVWYFHNTISIDGDATGTTASDFARGFYQTTDAAGIIFKNNIITVNRGGPGEKTAIFYNTATSDIISDENDFYLFSGSGTENVGYYDGNYYPTLIGWQGATGDDANSLSSNPIYTDPATGNFEPTNSAVNNTGSFEGILVDINNNTRSNTTPDIGAYEFTPTGCASPPTPGDATVSATPVCENTNVLLSVTGNSTGLGQVYRWQFATDIAGPFNDIGNFLVNPDSIIQASITGYYQLAVTCGGNTQYSTPVLLTVNPALPAGTYTIDQTQPASATNFTSFNAAKDAMACGIAGPVVFNVVTGTGPYNEQMYLGEIAGTSATNTITFNGNGETIQFAPSVSAERAVIRLIGTDYVTIDSLRIDASGGTYGIGIQVMFDADSNTIRNSTIITENGSTSTNYAGIAFSDLETSANSEGNTSDGNLIENNLIQGGYYGITIVGGLTNEPIFDNKVIGNQVQDFYLYGIYLNETENTLVKGNDISRPVRTNPSTHYGIYFTGIHNSTLTDGNRIHHPFAGNPSSTSTFYGIYFTGVDGDAGTPNIVANNAIYEIYNEGAHYALYNSSSDNVHYFHNSISLDHTANTTTDLSRGFHQVTAATGIKFINNIVRITRGGTGEKHAHYWSTTTSEIESDKNVYFIDGADGGNIIGSYGTADQITLDDWQTTTSQDAASIVVNPIYENTSIGDLTPISPAIDNFGMPVGVTTDILGQSRDAATPDVGAWEFNIPPCTAPPTPGTAHATPNVNICLETPIHLSLTGHSEGSGQTYQWEYSTSSTGPWTAMGNPMLLPDTTILASGILYYRVAVTCSGQTDYSEPVFVNMNPPFGSGVYTINHALPTGGTNFQTFTEAVDTLLCGIDGPVVFNVAPGTYNEQISIPYIMGSSEVNTVTFQAANGDATSVTLTYAPGATAENYVVRLINARHFIFDNLTISNTSATYGRVFEFAETASHDTLRNSIIVTPSTTATGTTRAAVFADDFVGTDILIKGNEVEGGAAGIYISGVSTTASADRVKIDSNMVTGAYNYLIYTGYIRRASVTNNEVEVGGTTNSTVYGIYSTNTDTAYVFAGNRVDINNTTSTAYGMYFTGSGSNFSDRGYITGNTIIAETGNTGTLYGIYQTTSTFNSTANNVISINTSGATSYGIYSTGGQDVLYMNNSVLNMSSSSSNNYTAYFSHTGVTGNVIVLNNIFSHGNGGVALYVPDLDGVYLDYNMLFTTGTDLVRYSSTYYADIYGWRAVSGYDLNSIVYEPAFESNTDLRPDIDDPDVWAIHGRGVQYSLNTYDFNNEPRPTTLEAGVPDLGAYEFLPTSVPIELTAIPAAPAAGTTQIFMLGTDTVTTVYWHPTSDVPSSITGRRYSGVAAPNLPSGADYMYFYTDFDTVGTGNYLVDVKQYYLDPWRGFIPQEPGIRLGRTNAANEWITEDDIELNTNQNYMLKDSLTEVDKYTGLLGTNIPPSPDDFIPVDNSNRGTRFWVGYGHNQGMETTAGQDMVLYLGTDDEAAVVTVSINGTSWSRTYNIPANTVITSDIIPASGLDDARLRDEGLYERGIKIVSDVDITAYAHIYAGSNSGATLLLPVGTYGYEYYALTSRQNYATNTFSWFYVIADRDNTLVEITPSKPTKGGRPAGVPFQVTLNKGEVYQVLGAIMSGSDGYDLTGSKVKSIANADGDCHPVAVFSGSSRTNIGCGTSNPSASGDNLIQQNFPFQAWGRKYLTAAASTSTDASSNNINIFKVAVKDPSTVVLRNGVPLTGLIDNLYYQFESNSADYIEADQPVNVAQFIPSSISSSGCGFTGVGDPEMIYLSPLEQGIDKVGLYRNVESGITVQYLTLIIPTAGLSSLLIDGSGTFDHVYAHPNYPGYSVVVKRWSPSSTGQTFVTSDSAFTAITYGLGSVESYGFNAGTMVRNLSAVPAFTNVYATTDVSPYTCEGTPFEVSVLIPIIPTSLEWEFSALSNISPNDDVIQNNPQPVDSVEIDGRKFYRFTVPQQYTITGIGTYYVPIHLTHPDIESCNNSAENTLVIEVIEAPASDFTVDFTGCLNDVAQFNGSGTTVNGVPIDRWEWDFDDNTTADIQNPTHQWNALGTYEVSMTAIAQDGCISESIEEVEVTAPPIVPVVNDTVLVCLADNAVFEVQNPDPDFTYNWYDAETGGNLVHTGSSFVANNITGFVDYYVEAVQNGCVGIERTRVTAGVLPTLVGPTVTVDSVGTNMIRFTWNAVPNATGYEVSTNSGATWTAPSSGTTGLTHTVSGLEPLQFVTLIVRAIGGCEEAVSAPVTARTVTDEVFIPNSFTPNGDGRNDVLQVYGYVFREVTFMVFNQWGEKIYESRDPQRAWDGTASGKMQPTGVYMYVCRLIMDDGTEVIKKGSINLIR